MSELHQGVFSAIQERMEQIGGDETIFALSPLKTPVSLHRNKIRFVQDLNPEDREDRDGHVCIGCNCELIPKLGDKRAWHFSHKSGASCTADGGSMLNETLLHIAAKVMVSKMNFLMLNSPISARSKIFPEFAEIEFPDKRLFFRNAICESLPETSSGKWRPDVMADLVGWEGRKILIEISVTHPVGEDKTFNVKAEDFDMIEIDLKDLHEKTKQEDVKISQNSLREYILDKAPRRWIHSRVQRILSNRVLIKESQRIFETCHASISSLNSRMLLIHPESEVMAQKFGTSLPLLEAWVKQEEIDEKESIADLEESLSIFRMAEKMDHGISGLRSLSPNMTYLRANQFKSDVSCIIEERKAIGSIRKGLSDILLETKSCLATINEEDRGLRELIIPALRKVNSIRDSYASSVERMSNSINRIKSSTESFDELMDNAVRQERLLMKSVMKVLSDVRESAIRALRIKEEQQSRNSRIADKGELTDSMREWNEIIPTIVLFDSWCKYPDHPDLGPCLDYNLTTENLRNLCRSLRDMDFPASVLHDMLQMKVHEIEVPVHIVLRYEDFERRSQGIMVQFMDLYGVQRKEISDPENIRSEFEGP